MHRKPMPAMGTKHDLATWAASNDEIDSVRKTHPTLDIHHREHEAHEDLEFIDKNI